MNTRITFRNMDKSDVMETYARQQLEKIYEFLKNERTPIHIDLIFEPSKLREHHRVELRVKTPNYDLISNYEYPGTGFYDVLDRVIDVMYKQLRDEKKKRVDSRKHLARADDFKKNR